MPRSPRPRRRSWRRADAQLGIAAEAWGETGPLRVRMGIHTCQAEVRDGDYYGSAVNRAARLESVANGGQVVLSLATEELARDGLRPTCRCSTSVNIVSATSRTPSACSSSVHPGSRRDFPPLQSLDAFPGNLPRQLSSFVGREEEVVAVVKALTESAARDPRRCGRGRQDRPRDAGRRRNRTRVSRRRLAERARRGQRRRGRGPARRGDARGATACERLARRVRDRVPPRPHRAPRPRQL